MEEPPYGPISRRELLRRFGYSAGGVALASMLASVDPRLVSAASVKDTLVIAQTADLGTFDPQRVVGIDAIVAAANMYDRLVYLDADHTVKPWLATSWEVSPDTLTWTFRLRRDARFHDGSPVTSEAVRFSINRAIGPGSGPSLSRTYLSAIAGVETPDPYTVRLTTQEPFGPMLRNVGHQTALAILNPRAVEARGGDLAKPIDVGGGMYKLVEWKPGEQLVLERDDNWWGPKPFFRRVIYKPVPDPTARSIMLEKGDADLATVLPLADVPRLGKDRALRLIQSNAVRVMFFDINVTRSLMNDVRIRKALNHAVDVETIIKSVLSGFGQRAVSLLAPSLEFYYPSYKFEYDPARARQLLSEAGVKPGTKVQIVGPQGRYPGDAEITQAVAGYLRRVGLEPELNIVGDYARYVSSVGPSKAWDLALDSWAPGNLDADGTFTALLGSRSSLNWSGYANSKADDLIGQARGSVDPKTRERYYRALQMLVGQEVPALLLHVAASFSGTRSNICGVEVRGDDANLIKNAKTC